MNFILIGPQGSGKGTQAELLVKKLGLTYFSPGEVFREMAKQNTPLGRRIDEFINKRGVLVPDDIMLEVLGDFFAKKDLAKGILIDGFPRNVVQAKLFDKWLASRKLEIDKVIFINISRRESIRRLSSRLICPKCEAVFNTLTKLPKKDKICDVCHTELVQRVDDRPAAIAKRLAVFQKETAPLIDFYERKGVLEKFNGERPIEAIFADILARLGLD